MNEPLERTPENIDVLGAKWGRAPNCDWVIVECESSPLARDGSPTTKQFLYRNYSLAEIKGIWAHWPEPCGIRPATEEEIATDDARISPEASKIADGGFASVYRLAAIPHKAPDQGQKDQRPVETTKSGWFEKRLRATKGRVAAIKGGWEDFWEAIGEYMVSWGYFWSLVRLAVVYRISSHECAFSVVQSIFLTVIWAYGVEARRLRRVAARQFVPFSFSISPTYRTILTDAGILSSDTEANDREWAALLDAAPEGTLSSGTECAVIDYNFDSDKRRARF